MKKNLILFVILVSFNLSVFSQDVKYDVTGNPIQFSNIIKTDSLIKRDRLYSLGLEWFATAYHNARYVLQDQDKDAGVIIGKGQFDYLVGGTNTQYVNYMVKLSFKDGKIKYEITNFISTYYNLMKDGEVINCPWISRSTIKRGYAKTQVACNQNGKEIAALIETYFSNIKPVEDF